MSTILPSMYGKLDIDFGDDFKREIQMHLSPEYLECLDNARDNINESVDGCCFCGFKDGQYLELHHVDGDHHNFEQPNLRLICTLCHRLKHLGWVGTNNLGKMLYLPRLPNESSSDQKLILEPLNMIQRFFLMEDYMPLEEKQSLREQPLYNSIDQHINAFKRQSINQTFEEKEIERRMRAGEREFLQEATTEQKAERTAKIEDDRQQRRLAAEERALSGYFHNLHLLDLLQAIQEVGVEEKRKFLHNQSLGKQGRMTIWFNKNVFIPFEPNPRNSFENRMEYYRQLGYFTGKGIANIMHNIRS